jgi:hypothetical protein
MISAALTALVSPALAGMDKTVDRPVAACKTILGLDTVYAILNAKDKVTGPELLANGCTTFPSKTEVVYVRLIPGSSGGSGLFDYVIVNRDGENWMVKRLDLQSFRDTLPEYDPPTKKYLPR